MVSTWATLVCTSAAAVPTITATVDRQILTTDETLSLIVQVNTRATATISRPVLPDLPDFEVLGTSSASRYQLGPTGGDLVMTYQYALRPLRAGVLAIGPITYTEGGRTCRTNPISVRVTQGTVPTPEQRRPPAASTLPRGDADIGASTDKTVAYVNEQITWTAKLWWTAEASISGYRPPAFDGFWTEQLPTPPVIRRILNGREYAMQQIRVALFPLAPGTLTISPASMEVSASPFGLSRRLSSKPITIRVKPLPESGLPAGFAGAVGDWRVSLATDATAVSTGQALTVTAVVTGTGNVQGISQPLLRAPPSFEVRKASSEKESVTSRQTVQGRARFEWVAIPRKPGNFAIGPAELPFFDPAQRAYRVAVADPVRVRVTGEPIAATGLGATSRARLQAVQNALVEPTRPPRLLSARRPLYRSLLFLASQIVPLLSLIGAAAYGSWRRRVATDPAYVRLARARREMREALSHARAASASDDAAGLYARLHKAVSGYVSARLEVPAPRLSPDNIAPALREAGHPEECALLAAELLGACERARFSGPTAEADLPGDVQRAERLFQWLERGGPAHG